MKNISCSIILFLIISNLYAQNRFSFGVNFVGSLIYFEDCYSCSLPILQAGVSAAKEVSLKTEVGTGLHYYQTKASKDSVSFENKYFEIPIFFKTKFSFFDRRIEPHLAYGAGVNFRFRERLLSKTTAGYNEKVTKKLKDEAINAFAGWGLDIRLTNALYFNFNVLCKVFYYFNKAGDSLIGVTHFLVAPTFSGGMFLRMN